MITRYNMYRVKVENTGEDRWKALGFQVDVSSKIKLQFYCDTPVDKISDLLCDLIVRKQYKVLLEHKFYYIKELPKKWRWN